VEMTAIEGRVEVNFKNKGIGGCKDKWPWGFSSLRLEGEYVLVRGVVDPRYLKE